MVTSETLGKLFPLEGEIPAEHKLAAPIHQRSWLVNGELRTWNGSCKAVLSPVCVRSPGGELKQLEMGSYPVMGETQSDEALDAAVAAYDNGRGEWPTMPVADRIDCMQDFVAKSKGSSPARDYRKPSDIHGTAIRTTSAMNKAVRCGHTRPMATSGDTRPMAHAA